MNWEHVTQPIGWTGIAADGAGPHLWLIAAGAAVVVLLVLAFVLGQRRQERKPPPVDVHYDGRRSAGDRPDDPV
ncbi:hypothetical protein [Kitasatospora sp. NPDC051914]|uniref:hypothetical protein n=1 Tax=Kitasatospora sp. NPDC051914 TaxID=3154945 RepID=UPI003447C4C6